MPFTIEQTTPLEITDKDGNLISILPGGLAESGAHEVIAKPQFKEDLEERRVVFTGSIEQGDIKVEVSYSIGIGGHEVQNVDVVKIPAGLELHSAPGFETRDN